MDLLAAAAQEPLPAFSAPRPAPEAPEAPGRAPEAPGRAPEAPGPAPEAQGPTPEAPCRLGEPPAGSLLSCSGSRSSVRNGSFCPRQTEKKERKKVNPGIIIMADLQMFLN